MAKKISSRDIFDQEDIFKGIRDSATKTITIMNDLQKEVMETAEALKKSIGGAKFDSAKAIKNVVDVTSKANKLKKESIQIDKLKKDAMIQESKALQELEKIEQQKLKTQSQQMRNDKQQTQEKERLLKTNQKAVKVAKDEASAYKKLEKNTRDLKNQSKELGAQMLSLEQSGKKNTKAYKDLSNQYKKVTASAQKGDKALKKIDQSVGDNFRNVGNYSSALGKLSGGLAKLGLAVGGIQLLKGAFTSLVSTSSEFSKELSGLQAISGASSSDMKVLSDQAKALGSSTQFTAKEVVSLQTELAKLGFSTDEISKSTGATLDLASSLGVGLPEASQLAGSTLRAFGLDASETGRVVDVMASASSKSALDFESLKESLKLVAPTSRAMGVSIEKTSALLGVLADNGLKGSVAGTGLSKTFIMLNKAGIPLSKAMDMVKNSGNKLNTAIDLVGIVGAKSLLTLSSNAPKIDKLSESFEKAEGTARKLAETRLDNLAGDTTKLGSAWEGFLLSIEDGTGPFNDLLRTIVQTATAVLGFLSPAESLTDAFFKQKEEVEKLEEKMNPLIERHEQLTEKAELSKDEQEELDSVINQIAEDIPLAVTEFDKYGKALGVNTDLAKEFILEQKEILKLNNAEAIEEQEDAISSLTRKLNTHALQLKKVNGVYVKQVDTFSKLNNVTRTNVKLTNSEIVSINKRRAELNLEIKTRKAQIALLKGEKTETEKKVDAQLEAQKLLDEATPDPDKKKDKEKEYNTEFKKTNGYISDQIKLLQDLKKIEQDRNLINQQKGIDAEFNAQMKNIEETGKFDADQLNKLIQEKIETETRYIKQRSEFAKQSLLDKYEFEKSARLQALNDERDALIKKAKGNKKALKTIEANYIIELKELQDDEIDRVIDNDLKIEKLEKDKNNKILKIKEDGYKSQEGLLIKFNKKVDDYQKEQDKKQIEAEKKKQQTIKQVVKQSADYFVKQSNRKIEQINKEVNKAQEQYDYFKQLASDGNLDAKDSLAEQQKIINEANKKKLQEEKRQQRIRLAESVFSTYSSKVESNSPNPLAETIRDTTLLMQFINSIPAFYDGTEDTGATGKGVDGRGGFHAVLHPNERVLPKSLNQQIGDLSNEELTRLAVDYKNGRVIEGASQTSSAMDLAILVNELSDIKRTIENKPETNIELGQITQSMMEVVKSTKKGNTIVYNRYKIKK